MICFDKSLATNLLATKLATDDYRQTTLLGSDGYGKYIATRQKGRRTRLHHNRLEGISLSR